jgi:hypothetical protein
MVRLRACLICAFGVLLVMPQAAAGGGWWSYIDVNRSHVAPGQRVELSVTVAFRSTAAAKAAQEADRFHVYLLRDFDDSVVEQAMRKASPGNWWSLGGAEAIEVGQVTINTSDSNLRRARAEFTVPELPPATYDLMICDAGCTTALPDVVPLEGFTVVADPATAQLANRLERLERRARTQAARRAGARSDAEKALVATRSAHSELNRLRVRVSSLENEDQSTPLAPPWAYAGWLGTGALGGVLALLVLRRRQARVERVRQV